ncbi:MULTISPECIES: patatin-like phospholipase family protein [unclassified Acidovorax]|uniref:patatin-like phospholipase family protein n=1 Tax=unclassified Acidovorax TaxID=2684926 RepID=UPI001C46E310|nr:MULTISPECIES: patatin-like phospholipase family protein [unclassified Acidovorax]MBV7430128.1 patatin-like phospholipase family protein [Acidovorax sp. sif0732]MBV7451521.1 patatin-like phospholipase family protein [Acidovorax sp. sif0715]
MKALRIHAGPRARQHLENHGLRPGDVGVIPAAAGGPKGLILGPLDRFIFGEWLAQSRQPVDLVGASIGAWRMATACLQQPVAAFERLEHDYIHQDYDLPPGKKRPSAAHVSERFGLNLQAFYGGRIDEVLNHPRYRLHIVTSRGRHLLGREHRVATPLGYLGAFLTNTVHRKAMGAWLERVVFSSSDASSTSAEGAGAACAALPFGTSDYRTRQVLLSNGNFMEALQASCSIPFVLQAVHNIPGAPRGAYWDGGITDYHLHLAYGRQKQNAIELIACGACPSGPGGQKDLNSASVVSPGLVLYPHFQHRVVPGWLDKGLKWRHRSTPALDNMVVLSPSPDWVRSLPNAKLPDRNDFTHYGADSVARAKAWLAATRASQQLVDEWQAWLARPDMNAVHPL